MLVELISLFLQRKHPGSVDTVNEYVQNIRKRKAEDTATASSSKVAKTSPTTIEECFAGSTSTKKVKQTEVDKAVADFIVHGIHPLSTVEQPAFINLISSELLI